ncbi:MAG: transporter ATP-binding protein [Alphaproteobacteria bacterium]|nr:transporter ATP-binding protein [Alphaproteobacteria bacterium]
MADAQNPPIISVHGLVNQFGTQIVHDHLDFEIDKPQVIGLVGGSGSGKSVLMRTIVGLQKPTEGEIKVMGEESNRPGQFGVLFQKGALFSALTVEENIMVPLKERGDLSEETCRSLARMKINLVGLPAIAAAKYPSELSGGMIKRASLARALAVDPPILFLDEPTAGLDPIAAAEFDQLVLELQKSLGVTIIIITHDLDTLFTVCDKVAVLVDKKMTLDTIENLLKSTHPWIQSYFHGPRGRAMLAKDENNETNGKSEHGT